MKTKQFFVFGRVQGVAFRFFTLQEAKQIGVTGRVRNREDGSVEVIAQGTEQQLSELKQWLMQGPPTAKVERLIENNYNTEQVYEKFMIAL